MSAGPGPEAQPHPRSDRQPAGRARGADPARARRPRGRDRGGPGQLSGAPQRPRALRRCQRRLQPDPLGRGVRAVRGPAGRARPRHVHDGHRGPRGDRLVPRPRCRRRLLGALHQACRSWTTTRGRPSRWWPRSVPWTPRPVPPGSTWPRPAPGWACWARPARRSGCHRGEARYPAVTGTAAGRGGGDVVVAARTAVAWAFFLNGLAFATWVSRTPAVRDALDLTPGRLGLLLLAMAAGAVVALPVSGALARRVGTARRRARGRRRCGRRPRRGRARRRGARLVHGRRRRAARRRLRVRHLGRGDEPRGGRRRAAAAPHRDAPLPRGLQRRQRRGRGSRRGGGVAGRAGLGAPAAGGVAVVVAVAVRGAGVPAAAVEAAPAGPGGPPGGRVAVAPRAARRAVPRRRRLARAADAARRPRRAR